MDGLSDYLVKFFRAQRRNSLLIVVFLLFLITIPYYTSNFYENDLRIEYDHTPKTSPPPNESEQDIRCPHYKTALFISSDIEDIDKRMLMREELFGIADNLVPCMKQDTTEIFYKFLVKKKDVNEEMMRNFKSEEMEYNDIGELKPQGDEDWQQTLLKHSQLLQDACLKFDHLVIIDIYTMINLEKLQHKISSLTIANQTISNTQQMVWGSFNSNLTDSMALVIGSSAIKPILDHPNYKSTKGFTNIISRFYHYHYNHPHEKIQDDLILINDPVSIVEWPNSIKSIPCVDCVIAIGHVYQDWEIRKIKNKLNISTIVPCKVRSDLEMYSKDTSKLRPNIVVVTSSFLYRDNCMTEAAPISARNKREYAEKHGYAFVARSSEFTQQLLRKRKEVWGKIDAVEKILPYYEWLIWLDMDAIFVNKSLSVEDLLKMCEKRVGGKEKFEKINFIVARPVGDDMINAGVFLIRNSEWARDFIRAGVQSRRDRAYRGMKEQQAMRDAIKRPNWKPGVLYLDGDDHTINTFPDRYLRGDYIVHYAPEEGCPATPVLGGITKVKLLEESPGIEVELPF